MATAVRIKDRARPRAARNRQVATPIAVDLDRTFLTVDTLHEGISQLASSKPWMLAALPYQLLRGKAAFKQFVHTHAPLDIGSLPVQEDLLEYLRRQRRSGRRIGLFSAADQRIVDACSARFGIFDVAVGSDGERNLAGTAKLQSIRDELGPEFVYAGDHRVDMPIWRQSKAAIYAGRSKALRSKVAGATEVEFELSPRPAGARDWLRGLRVHQWPKNVLVFVPALISIPLLTAGDLLNFALAFIALCTIASATYLINDLADVSADRAHPSKKARPFASGTIGVGAGAVGAVALAGLAVVMLSLLPLQCALMLGLYAVVSLTYSFQLKRVPILDVLCLGFLFTVRIAIGASLLENSTPYWLYVFSMFFFTSLAFVKRYRELAVAAADQRATIAGRSYEIADLPLVCSAGVGSALCSIVVFVIYLGDQHFDGNLFRNPGWLGLAVGMLAYWLLRTWLLTVRNRIHDDPVVFALKDRTSYLLGLLVGLSLFLAW